VCGAVDGKFDGSEAFHLVVQGHGWVVMRMRVRLSVFLSFHAACSYASSSFGGARR
jgi:hypothetical protein